MTDLIMQIILPGLWATLYMMGVSGMLGTLFGFATALALYITEKDGLRPNLTVYTLFDFVVNTIRSFPFIVLLVAIVPVTKIIVGRSIGPEAAIVPLTIAATPFIGRIIFNSMKEVDPALVEAGKAFGLSDLQIIFKVVIVEALPSIVLNVAVIAITLLGYSAMAGTVGGGGLGDLAVKYGYNRFQVDIMVYSVIILCLLVLLIQGVCNFLYKILR